MKETSFQLTTLISVGLGLGLGLLLKFLVSISPPHNHWIQMPGEIFINVLQLFAVPLIVTSVIAGVTDLNTPMSKKTAILAATYVCGTTLTAVAIGLTLVLLAKPGEGQDISSTEKVDVPPISVHLVLQDLLRNMIPENFLQAFYEQYKTDIVQIKRKDSLHNISQNATDIKLIGKYIAGANMVGLVIWSFVIGILLNRAGRRAKVAVEAIHCLNSAIKIIFNWILWYLPLGVLFLVAHQVLEIQDWTAIIKLTKLSGLVLLGLVIHGFVFLPGLYFVILRRNPFVVFKKASRALITALIIASSSATLPVTFQCCEEKMKVNERICRLILPIVTTINMNGTGLYEVIATIFVAQINDIVLDIGQLISIGFGTAGIPATGAVSTILVLTAVGLPAEDAYILLVVEWLLDHFNTTLNVLGDCFGVAVIDHLCHDALMGYNIDSVRDIGEVEKNLSCLEPNKKLVPRPSHPPSGFISP
ncbi:PREDICTED: excitatory amino acid transporter 3-like isoform X2 [Poecilia mexicana]|uniref:excitatory amino acid transporter 3-like isoform X2 n=1 Tax=Poecilia mexicana TaxID=48701 RepID=UPI00072EA7E5|nr:PREDICTED: excitatory amino acid transporter 3-like isoform X2 [Poecilia mexicana]